MARTSHSLDFAFSELKSLPVLSALCRDMLQLYAQRGVN